MAELKIISMDEVKSKEVNWLWYPYIPYGKITIIQGKNTKNNCHFSGKILIICRFCDPDKW